MDIEQFHLIDAEMVSLDLADTLVVSEHDDATEVVIGGLSVDVDGDGKDEIVAGTTTISVCLRNSLASLETNHSSNPRHTQLDPDSQACCRA